MRNCYSGCMSMRRLSILLAVLCGGLFLIFAVFTWPVWGSMIQDYSTRVAFSESDWLAGVDGRAANPKRTQMVDSLLQTVDFHGRTKTEVIAILGDPTPADYFSEYDLVYWLGPERGFLSIDDEWLVFTLDNSAKVSDYRVITD